LPSVGLLYRVFAEFTPEELSSIDLIPLNKSSLLKISATGRARSRTVHEERPGSDWLDRTRDQTISCVSGFLINMVERSIALVTPCNSSDKHPLGYITVARDEFSNAADLDAIVREMMAVRMPLMRAARRRAFATTCRIQGGRTDFSSKRGSGALVSTTTL
jgi:hypothetical protein